MLINIFDAVAILFLLMGMVIGFKKGAIQMIAYVIGTILLVYLSWTLKTPLAEFLYTHLPFFKLSGKFAGMTIINILIYQGIAFIIILLILSSILGIILKITGILSKIVDKSIILTLPSKLIGILLGFIEAYIIVFVLLFVFSQFSFSHEYLRGSKMTDTILKNTPLTYDAKNSYIAFNKISDISKENKSKNDKNKDSADTLVKYKIIDIKTLKKLDKYGKLQIKGLDKYLKDKEVKDND